MKKILIHLSVLTAVILPVVLLAQQTGGNTEINIPNPVHGAGNDLMSLITALLNNVVMPIAAVAVVMWIVWAGFTFLMAQGKPAEIDKAKQRLLWSLIGAGILLGAAGISTVVVNTINALTH